MGDQAATTRHEPEDLRLTAAGSGFMLLKFIKSCGEFLRDPEKSAIFAAL